MARTRYSSCCNSGVAAPAVDGRPALAPLPSLVATDCMGTLDLDWLPRPFAPAPHSDSCETTISWLTQRPMDWMQPRGAAARSSHAVGSCEAPTKESPDLPGNSRGTGAR